MRLCFNLLIIFDIKGNFFILYYIFIINFNKGEVLGGYNNIEYKYMLGRVKRKSVVVMLF